MKMNQNLLLTASVFFVLLVLIECGVATIFYNDVSHKKETDLGETVVQGKFTFTKDDSLNMISTGTGPSLLLGYTVTDNTNTPYEVSYITEFNTRYRKNGHFGQAISSSEILSITNNEKQYRLYQLSNIAGTPFKSPLYAASAEDPSVPDCNYTLTLQGDNSLKLEIPEYELWNGSDLRRSNGQVFTKDISIILANASNYPDYLVQTSSTSLYIHLYGAMNVSEGDFSNIFWSPLSYLGYIALGSSE